MVVRSTITADEPLAISVFIIKFINYTRHKSHQFEPLSSKRVYDASAA